MKKIFLDIGNSRIKWSKSINGKYQFCNAVLIETFVANPESSFFEEIDFLPDEVYFCAVSSAKQIERIKSAIHQQWGTIAIQLSSQENCCGLTNGYDDFHLLGDDRWMALLGASQLTKEPFIVVDIGTAITVDAVIEGKHQGGFIVPGIRSLRSSLAKDTADLSLFLEPTNLEEPAEVSLSGLATNTEAGILGGTLYMVASFVNQVIHDINLQMQTECKVFLTGGDAALLQKLVDVSSDLESDLVLQGMYELVESVKSRKKKNT